MEGEHFTHEALKLVEQYVKRCLKIPVLSHYIYMRNDTRLSPPSNVDVYNCDVEIKD